MTLSLEEKRRLIRHCSLYGIIDLNYVSANDAAGKTCALLAGGVRVIQLRAKNTPMAQVTNLARALQKICHDRGAIFVLNDYIDLAAELRTDALHIGQDAGLLEDIRPRLPEQTIIGRSTHNWLQALVAVAEGADYIGFGPLFPTQTKPGRKPIGLDDIATVRSMLPDFPVFCIGGINPSTLPRILEAGGDHIVVVSWLLTHADPTAAAHSLISALPITSPDDRNENKSQKTKDWS